MDKFMAFKLTSYHIAIFLSLVLTFFHLPAYSQNIIGGSSGDPSALIDLQSTDKGLLIRRMSTE
jgi:hypothetical protein